MLLGLATLAILPLLALSGCGGGYFGPAPKTYTVTGTGTIGFLQGFTTNAPPGQCGCFSANGGFGSIVFNTPHGFSIVVDLNAAHAGNAQNSLQNDLRASTAITFRFGPR